MIRSICVFCGSSLGVAPVYREAAREVGGLLGRRDIELVYGGGHVGLMGVVADACLEAGGRVIGVIPQALADKVSVMVDQNMTGAKLQVNPPELGPIEVRISVQGNRAEVWLSAHSPVTRDALEAGSPKLREMLGGQGFGQVSVDVSQRSFQERTPQSQAYQWTPPAEDGASAAAAGATATVRTRAASCVLDAYA